MPNRHFLRSDIFTVAMVYSFYFRLFSSNESNSNVVNFVGVGYTIILTQKKVFHLFFSGNSNSRRWFSESVSGDI